MSVVEQTAKKKELASYLSIVCRCCYSRNFYTSNSCGSKGGREVNRRFVYGMRACEVGYSGIEKFTTFMNMPAPMTKNNYNKITHLRKNAAKKVANKSMRDAALVLKAKVDIADVGVSVDGTWKRRGYSSLNGVVTAISVDSEKILDCEVLTKFCNGCAQKQTLKRSDANAYESWKVLHKCKINHTGSSSSME